MAYFLGVDISTTSSKALLINGSGEVVEIASAAHTLQSPHPLWSEQNPEEWWQAASQSIRDVLAKTGVRGEEIKGVGLTGQMHGLVLLDAQGLVLRPAILWNDQRTQAQCNEIHQKVGKERFIQISGNVALTGFTAPKILWVAENEPQVYAKARHILLPKDYVRFRLTGEYAMDKADGAGTVLFDLKKRTWSEEILKTLNIPAEWLPPTFEGPETTGLINAEAAAQTGLAVGTPVAAGGGDQAAQAVGVGAVKPGVVALTVGTSGVVFAPNPSPLVEPQGRLHAFCHAVPGMWHFMGVMLSAAGSLQWYRDTLAHDMDFNTLVEEARQAPSGSEGLQFLPYLTGERTPHPDPLARGAFIGLTTRHTRGHMTRAVLEGVAYGLKDGFRLIQEAGGGTITQVRASGGGTKGALWREILASVLEVELATVNTAEGGAYGAALLAGTGAGNWKSVAEACEATIRITGKTAANEKDFARYREGYGLFRELYPALKFVFDKM